MIRYSLSVRQHQGYEHTLKHIRLTDNIIIKSCTINTFICPLIIHCYSFSHEINILSLATGTPVKHPLSALQLRAPDGNWLARLAIASERTSSLIKSSLYAGAFKSYQLSHTRHAKEKNQNRFLQKDMGYNEWVIDTNSLRRARLLWAFFLAVLLQSVSMMTGPATSMRRSSELNNCNSHNGSTMV